MPNYHMVMSEEFFEHVRNGALDHWQGEIVPVRGPDRRIIGEATIVSVDHRDDGTVSIVVSSELDMDFRNYGSSIAEVMRGRMSASFSAQEPEPEMPLLGALMKNEHIKWADAAIKLPHQPNRDCDVARWLKAKRDAHFAKFENEAYWAIDELLDEYRARADYGLTLDDPLSELPDGW